jgi:hypothetical protein
MLAAQMSALCAAIDCHSGVPRSIQNGGYAL